MSSIKRLAALAAGLAVAAATFTATTATAQTLPQPECYDGATVWGVEDSGRLFTYLHVGAETGSHDWGAKQYIGVGWHGTVLAGSWGTLYFIPEGSGELRRYQWDGTRWETFGGAQYEVIGHGFDRYVGAGRTFAAVGAKLYGIDDTGELRYWYRDGGEWQNPDGEVIGTGWDVFDRVVPSNQGTFYAFDGEGDAYLYQYDNNGQWDVQARHIDSGWGDFTTVATAGSGVLYATTTDGQLLWYRYYNGWEDNGIPRQVGEGWNGVTLLFNAGHCQPHPG
ncbi:hypothetical protein JOD54_004433 [Actinokineospora baliensis]|uniref:tachylectin-related carbohydrate-binding protein n=1 Tax=Actinokineospora baliensis TaxID=547056 RepID=UPI00195DB557|nr:tachylectin-related carbohydrate-binding protein [Actinokineospora baliensis]MBM7774229.1 hypothetical protein [Actinokineospora baliensis]